MATVELKNVFKRYHRTEVIHGVNLEVNDGEFLVIVGPSGCGKSTLLRMVAGLESITAGEVCINGAVVNKLEPRERDVAMVFQNYALYPHMSVYNNMAYGLKIAGMSRDEIEQRVQKAATTLELGELLKRRPAQLSGGQRQRVAMGRAIVREPQVFLFDEPLSNLDAKLRVQMRLEIKQLQTELGTTALYVTHDQTEAMTLADRLVVMHDGVAEQIDDPMTVFEKPATTFVASFIGSPPMNLFRGKLIQFDGGVALECAEGTVLPVVAQLPAGAGAGDELVMGIRPDALRLSVSDSAAQSQAAAHRPGDWQAHVAMIEPLGSDALMHCLIGSDSQQLSVTVRGETNKSLRSGADARLSFEPASLHWFDANGKRLP